MKEAGKKALILTMALLLGWAPGAAAEMYAGPYGSLAAVPGSDIEGAGPLSGAQLRDVELDPGWGFGGKIGYWFKAFPYLAFEGNIWTILTGISGDADLIVAGIDQGSCNLDADLTLVNFSGSLLAQYPSGRLRPYAGVGFLVSYADVGAINAGAFTGPGEDTTSPGILAQAGLEYRLSDLIGLFGEYRYTWANYNFDFEELDASTHNFLIGAAIHF